MKKILCQTPGLKLVQMSGSFLELFFKWEQLPSIDLAQDYYLVKIVPESDVLPVEYAKPNSAGPLYFSLREEGSYHLILQRAPILKYEVTSSLPELPHIDLIPEHEALHKLTWGNIDIESLKQQVQNQVIIISVDGKQLHTQSLEDAPTCEIAGRPDTIQVELKEGPILFQIKTNRKASEDVLKLNFTVEKEERRLFLSTLVKPEVNWCLRTEIPAFFHMHRYWQNEYQKVFEKSLKQNVVGGYRYSEDGVEKGFVRQFGFSTPINREVVKTIQKNEWKLNKDLPVKTYKLQLQITSAHRELYKTILCEREFSADKAGDILGFSPAEISDAEQHLFEMNHLVNWEQSFLELVVYFKSEGHDWQEFQREIASCPKWEYYPDENSQACQAEWVLYDIAKPACELKGLTSGIVTRPVFEPKVVLQPYSDKKILAWWNIDKKGVEKFIHEELQASLDEVGFYLKIHEEYLGDRRHRPDLECHIIDLFSSHQNMFFGVDAGRCFSAELVVRYGDQERALTAVSKSIVIPKSMDMACAPGSAHRRLETQWYHTSQREVRHVHGKDSSNLAKVMLHLHMHSPNLFRADPFRESYLKDATWPIRTAGGEEVHNTPGEWIMKNCLDSWLPLLRVFKNLAAEGVDYQVSLDITPPVAYTLSSTRFKDYFSRYLLRVQAHAKSQIALMKSCQHSPDYIWGAERYLADVEAIDRFYNIDIQKDMIGAFRQLEMWGFLELSTCTATHGMAAELEATPDSLDAQFTLAARSHHRIFGDRPKGIWLAENSYFPGVEKVMEKEDLHYCFVEAEAVLCGSNTPAEEEFNPLLIPQSEVVAFGRSRLGRTQVWDAKLGYAGHPDFREYHYRHMGLPLKKITSKTSHEKLPYNPDHAEKTARMLAQDFHHKLCDKAYQLSQREMSSYPLITCSYDAELFGHHWSEGPIFLEELLREVHRANDMIGFTTPSHYLSAHPVLPDVTPNPSTWGHDAQHVRWSDPKVCWVFRELEKADAIQKHYLSRALKGELSLFQKQAVEQMGVELVRSHSSDLTFVIMSGDFEEDMRREIQKYLDYFYRLKTLIDNQIEDTEFLNFRRYENDMFPEIADYYQIR